MLKNLLIAGLNLLLTMALAGEPSPIPPTHHVLIVTSRGGNDFGAGQLDAWLKAMATAGYTPEQADDADLALSARDLLEKYDAIIATTSVSRLPPALEEFLRQGGGLILVQNTSDQTAWIFNPINLILPTTFCNLSGYGWNTRFSAHEIRAIPDAAHATTDGIDWKSAPPLAWMYSTPPPDDDLYRGNLGLLEPRQDFLKPLLNCDWKVVLRADDVERSPLAVTGSYGRGRIFLWDAALGGSPDNFALAAAFTQWDEFGPWWGKVLNWTTSGGKMDAPQPAVWIVGDAIDNPNGLSPSKKKWALWRDISYALPDFGLSRATGAGDASAALILQADPAQETALAPFVEAGKPVVVCDPAAIVGALKPASPLTDATAQPPALPPLILGTPVPPPPPNVPPRVSAPPVSALADPALQPPSQWSIRATGTSVFDRDLEQKWFSPDYDSSAWEKQPLHRLTQTIGGMETGYDGAIWYRATIGIPADAPPDALWLFRAASGSLKAWANGREIALQSVAQPDGKGWALPLKSLQPESQVLALRLYKAAFADSKSDSRNLYSNTGLIAASALQGNPAPAPAPFLDMSSPKGLVRTPNPSTLAAGTPFLFTSRADGDKDFHLTFQLTTEQAARSPLLIFDEPGLIRRVSVNAHAVDRVGQGAWDAVSGGNTSAFLLRNVLHAGENTLDFHPDFSRFRNLDYPVANEVMTRCGLPQLQWTGDLQVLQAVDPAFAVQVPNRLFKPGPVYVPAPDAQVLLSWNDGRPALVRRGSVTAWTSSLVGQMNAAIIDPWSLPWESMGDFARTAGYKSGRLFGGIDGLPRGDSLLWENAAPLLGSALAQALLPGAPQLQAVRPVAGQRALEVEISNAGPARAALLSYRLLDWLGSIVASEAEPIQLAANGTSKIRVPIPASGFAGETMKPEWELSAALRSADNLTGFSYLEKVVETPSPIRVSIATDSAMERFHAGALPDRLEGSPGYRGRHLWWPLIFEDPGSSIYLDGETAHVRVTFHNETDSAQTIPVTAEVRSQIPGSVAKSFQSSVVLPPHGQVVITLDAKLTGDFEPYLVKVQTGDLAPEQDKALYSVQPWKHNLNIDRPPGVGMNFYTVAPFYQLQQPDNINPERFNDLSTHAMLKSDFEWLNSTETGTRGGGGGCSGVSGDTQGFAWGPFDQSSLNNVPNQMSFFPNGEPVTYYTGDGFSREQADPAYHTLADYWVNFSVPFNWQTLAAFHDWLTVSHPDRAQEFAPKTMDEAESIVRAKFAPEWNDWQNAVVSGSWGAVRDASAPGSLFTDQADHAFHLAAGWPSAASGLTDGLPLAKFFGDFMVTADPDAATQRVGWGYRFRSYLEGTAAALAPNMHFNVSSIRQGAQLNEQRMCDWGNATTETYRSFAYDTVWSAAVRPDGTLRAVVDTPPSEVAGYPDLPYWSGLVYGNLLYDRIYRLCSVIEPQRALGTLWVAPLAERMAKSVDGRALYETLRNNGVPLSAMISPENLSVAPQTGASGLVYLLPDSLKPEEIRELNTLAAAKFPVVCLVASEAKEAAAQVPPGITMMDLPATFSPDSARKMAATINEATGHALAVSEGACVYGFGAQHRAFVIVQNMWSTRREIEVAVDTQSAGLAGKNLRAVNLNDNSALSMEATDTLAKLKFSLGPWDAALVLLAPTEAPDDAQK